MFSKLCSNMTYLCLHTYKYYETSQKDEVSGEVHEMLRPFCEWDCSPAEFMSHCGVNSCDAGLLVSSQPELLFRRAESYVSGQ